MQQQLVLIKIDAEKRSEENTVKDRVRHSPLLRYVCQVEPSNSKLAQHLLIPDSYYIKAKVFLNSTHKCSVKI